MDIFQLLPTHAIATFQEPPHSAEADAADVGELGRPPRPPPDLHEVLLAVDEELGGAIDATQFSLKVDESSVRRTEVDRDWFLFLGEQLKPCCDV